MVTNSTQNNAWQQTLDKMSNVLLQEIPRPHIRHDKIRVLCLRFPRLKKKDYQQYIIRVHTGF